MGHWLAFRLEVRREFFRMRRKKDIFGFRNILHLNCAEIARKMKGAYCPEKTAENNPVLEMCEHFILRDEKDALFVERPAKFGGDVAFASYEELKSAYVSGKLHPMDLKSAAADSLSKMLEPSREYFEKKPELLLGM